MTTEKNHIFTPPAYAGHSPRSWYEEAKGVKNFIFDPAQEKAVLALDELWQEIRRYRSEKKSFFRRLKKVSPPKGLYMWGGVGRGKSFLMDMFYNCLPFPEKKRVHFHAFMAEVQRQMQLLKDEDDPLMVYAKQLATDYLVLCFDEFHVSDIADAMILGRLLEALLAQNLILVATSNYKPDDLYYQGQNRYSFLPTIALINSRLKVIRVDSGEDYRLRALTESGVYLIPDSPPHEEKLAGMFAEVNADEPLLPNTITLLGRKLTVKKRTQTSIWFTFTELCCTARSQQDYLELAREYQYLFISGVRGLDPDDKNIARRFTWLIDICYDYRLKVCFTASVAIDAIYPAGDFANEFKRTESRLIEMKSEEYLKLPHLTLE